MSHREKTGVAKWIYTTSLEPLDQLLADVLLTAVESPEFPSSWDIRMQTCQLNSKVLHSAPFTHLTAQGVEWRVVTSARRVPSPLPKSTIPTAGGRCGICVHILNDTGEVSSCLPMEKSIQDHPHQVHTASNHTDNQDTWVFKNSFRVWVEANLNKMKALWGQSTVNSRGHF